MNERDGTDTDTGSEAPPGLGGPRSCESRAVQAGMRASAARKACVCHPVQCDALRGTMRTSLIARMMQESELLRT